MFKKLFKYGFIPFVLVSWLFSYNKQLWASSDVLPAPMASYKFEHNLQDSTGHYPDLVVSDPSKVEYVPGVSGDALYPKQNPDFSPDLSSKNKYSMAFWINPQSTGGERTILAGIYSSLLGIRDRNWVFNGKVIKDQEVEKGKWTFVAFAFDLSNNAMRIIIQDSVYASTLKLSNSKYNDCLEFAGSDYFDEVTFYDGILTLDQIGTISGIPVTKNIERYNISNARSEIMVGYEQKLKRFEDMDLKSIGNLPAYTSSSLDEISFAIVKNDIIHVEKVNIAFSQTDMEPVSDGIAMIKNSAGDIGYITLEDLRSCFIPEDSSLLENIIIRLKVLPHSLLFIFPSLKTFLLGLLSLFIFLFGSELLINACCKLGDLEIPLIAIIPRLPGGIMGIAFGFARAVNYKEYIWFTNGGFHPSAKGFIYATDWLMYISIILSIISAILIVLSLLTLKKKVLTFLPTLILGTVLNLVTFYFLHELTDIIINGFKSGLHGWIVSLIMLMPIAILWIILHVKICNLFIPNEEIIKGSSDTNANISNLNIKTCESSENINASQNIYVESPWNPNEFSTFVKKFENAAEIRDQTMTTAAELINTQHSTRLLEVFEENEEVWSKSSSNLEMIINLMQDATSTKEARKLLQRAYDILSEMEKSTATVAAAINKAKEEYQSNYYQEGYSHDPKPDESSSSDNVSSLFVGVTSLEELKKRYLSLVKIYHPDNQAGDTEMTKKIQQEYERLMKQYKQ